MRANFSLRETYFGWLPNAKLENILKDSSPQWLLTILEDLVYKAVPSVQYLDQ